MAEHRIFRYSMQIKEHHLDSFRHVNNATYLQILEEARWEFLNDFGFTLDNIHATGIGPVVLEFHLKFVKEILLRQTIEIESQLLSFEHKVGIMRQDIFDDQKALCCQAKMTFGFFDIKSRKLIVPDERILQALLG